MQYILIVIIVFYHNKLDCESNIQQKVAPDSKHKHLLAVNDYGTNCLAFLQFRVCGFHHLVSPMHRININMTRYSLPCLQEAPWEAGLSES